MVEIGFKAGDFVRIRLATEEIDATILECNEEGIVLVKLESGYNVGIQKDNILGYRILKSYKPEERKAELSINRKKELPSVGLIVTGGTIAAKLNSKTG